MLTMRVYGRLGDPKIGAEYLKVSKTINLPPPTHLGIHRGRYRWARGRAADVGFLRPFPASVIHQLEFYTLYASTTGRDTCDSDQKRLGYFHGRPKLP